MKILIGYCNPLESGMSTPHTGCPHLTWLTGSPDSAHILSECKLKLYWPYPHLFQHSTAYTILRVVYNITSQGSKRYIHNALQSECGTSFISPCCHLNIRTYVRTYLGEMLNLTLPVLVFVVVLILPNLFTRHSPVWPLLLASMFPLSHVQLKLVYLNGFDPVDENSI